jgi:cytochrome oxidase Cu insertion factor (SCO1/SenC/PrrC family)
VKKLILFAICLVLVSGLFAQRSGANAPYLRFPTIPPFTLLKADSSKMTRDDLPKNRKTMIMYFSPTCEHCQLQTDSMLANMNKLKDIEILMASYQPLNDLKVFYEEKQLHKYKNIRMGYDMKYFFPPFYKMVNLPFMALYNNKGQFITSFQGNAPIDKILEAFSR